MKKCTECGETKPLGAFDLLKASTDGHRTKCKVCTNKNCAVAKAYFWIWSQ